MSTFRSIEELVKSLDREKELLKEMFAKRKSLSFRYDYALEMTEYKEERIRYLIDYGVIRDTGDFLEMEDIYLKFFEDVLEVNEEINVSFVQDYLTRLNENIDYYLKENNEQRKYNYQREVKRCLKNIALTTVRNVMDLKRNMDNTYKNEPNYKIKKTKLVRLDEKRNNIALLIRKSEELIDYGQPVFFRVAMDVQMRNVVSDVKLQLNDSYHNLIEIQKQIIHYLNLMFDNVRLLTTNSSSELFEQMVRIGENDVIIGISFPRYSMRTLKALEFANNRSAKVITITDSIHSPMNLYSSCNLIADSDMASIVDSLVAPLSVINALVVALCMKKQKEVAGTLTMLEDIWDEYQVYSKDELNMVDDKVELSSSKAQIDGEETYE